MNIFNFTVDFFTDIHKKNCRLNIKSAIRPSDTSVPSHHWNRDSSLQRCTGELMFAFLGGPSSHLGIICRGRFVGARSLVRWVQVRPPRWLVTGPATFDDMFCNMGRTTVTWVGVGQTQAWRRRTCQARGGRYTRLGPPCTRPVFHRLLRKSLLNVKHNLYCLRAVHRWTIVGLPCPFVSGGCSSGWQSC